MKLLASSGARDHLNISTLIKRVERRARLSFASTTIRTALVVWVQHGFFPLQVNEMESARVSCEVEAVADPIRRGLVSQPQPNRLRTIRAPRPSSTSWPEEDYKRASFRYPQQGHREQNKKHCSSMPSVCEGPKF